MFDRTSNTVQLQLFGFHQIRLPHTLFEHVYLQLALQLWQYNQERHQHEITDFDLPLCRQVLIPATDDLTIHILHSKLQEYPRKVWLSKRAFDLPVAIYESDLEYRLMWGSLVSAGEGYNILLQQSNGLPTYVEYHRLDSGKHLGLIWRAPKTEHDGCWSEVKVRRVSLTKQIDESTYSALVSTWTRKIDWDYQSANVSEINIGISEKPIPVQELSERLLDRITS